MNGFINIFKPIGMTSSQVVQKVKGILRRSFDEKIKVGHLGTLDPLAFGVLPISVGRATRLFDCLQEKKKKYIATFRFGETSETLDSDGEIIKEDGVKVNKNSLESILPMFLGEIEQIPPKFSAKSVDGRQAYDLARQGIDVDLKPKTVTIYSIKLLDVEELRKIYSNNAVRKSAEGIAFFSETAKLLNDRINADGEFSLSDNEFALEIVTGSGTYIRSLARDIASALHTVGLMTSLLRTATGNFDISNAVTLAEFEKNPKAYLLPTESALSFKRIDVDKNAKQLLNGVPVFVERLKNPPFSVYVDNNLVGIGDLNKDGNLYLKTRLDT